LLNAVEQQLEAHLRRLGSQKQQSGSLVQPRNRAVDLDLLRIELRVEHFPLMLTVQRRDPKLGHERPS